MSGRFRDVVRRMRRAASLSQKELASRLGTTQSAIARWETGEVSPRLDTVARIADACGLDAHIVWAENSDVDRNQIRWHLSLTPRHRLQVLREMLAFEARMHAARLVGPARPQPPAPASAPSQVEE
jgi:transcriptional regulator with XRE-family HTH domain